MVQVGEMARIKVRQALVEVGRVLGVGQQTIQGKTVQLEKKSFVIVALWATSRKFAKQQQVVEIFENRHDGFY